MIETTLLLKSRLGARTARAFPRFVKESGIGQIHVDEAIHERALERFSLDEGLSLTDAATVEIISRLRIGTLATYDERSFTKYAKDIVGRGSWERLTAQEQREAEEIDRAR
jgi:predicted nucleic acid-binding protein